MKLGIVGAGMIVQDLLPVFKSIPQIDLVAILEDQLKKNSYYLYKKNILSKKYM